MVRLDQSTRRKLTVSAVMAIVVAALQALGGLLAISTIVAGLLHEGVGHGHPSAFAHAAALVTLVVVPSVVAQAAGVLVIGASWLLPDTDGARFWRLVRVFWWTGAAAMVQGPWLLPPLGLLWLAPLLLAWQPSGPTEPAR